MEQKTQMIEEIANKMSNENLMHLEQDGIMYIRPSVSNSCNKILKINSINRNLINSCMSTSCPIRDKSWARGVSNGNLDATIMLVDAFPEEYDAYGGCFTGDSGLLIEQALSGKKSRNDIYCTVMIKCHNVHDTTPDIVRGCLKTYFVKELEIIKPTKLILTYSAFQACQKYNIIYNVKDVNYFMKSEIDIPPLNMFKVGMYVIYDFKQVLSGDEKVKQSFVQGLQSIV